MSVANVYSGVPAYGTGVNGQALTSGVLQASVPAASNAWTLEAWVLSPTTAPSTDIAFLGWGASGGWFGINAGGYIATNNGGTGASFPRDNQFHHVVVECLNDGRLEYWVDGQFISEFGGPAADATMTLVYLGGRQSAGHQWVGAVDEVRYSYGTRYNPYVNFTPPSAPLSVDSSTAALWHLNGDGTDSVNNSSNAGTGGGSSGGSTGGGTGGGSGGGTGGGSGGSTTPSSTYAASNDLIAIPERGWWLYTDTHLTGNGQTTPLDQSAMTAARTGSRTVNGLSVSYSTLVFRYYFLDNYAYNDTIAQADLDAIASDLVKARAAGVKLIIRFAYTKDNSDDAPVARAVKQINQIAPVLNAGADVIHALQAGFVGRWGEWYYSNNYGDQNSVSDANWSDRLTVLNTLLTLLDTRIFVQVRYVGIRQRLLNSTSPNPGGYGPRVGLHNDAFTASYADYGTYTTYSSQSESFNRDYLANMTAVPVGGESETSGDGSWAAAQPQLDRYNWSYFNPNYNGQIQGTWTQENWDSVTRLLGHRLRLVSATLPTSVSAGTTVTAQIVLTNDGWAVISRNRPVNLILDNGAGVVLTYPATVDLRTINAGQQVTATVSFPAPIAGTYSTYLALPDPSSSISARPEYALQLANASIWNASTGRHALGQPITVTAAGSTAPANKVFKVTKMTVNGVTTVVKLL